MAIKSFESKKISAKDLIKKESILVSDYMKRNVVYFHPEDNLQKVISILLEKKISGGPVIDDNKNLLGIISEGDCLKQISETRYYNSPETEKKVKDYMTKNVFTINENTSVYEAINLFLERKKRKFPIVKNGKLVGLITQKEILKAFLKMQQQYF